MLTLIGLTIILTIVILLLTEKVSPVICLILVPFIGALIAGFDLATIEEYYKSGVGSVLQVVIMFVFAILFFGVMNDVGLFDPIIKGMIRITRGNVIAVTVGTVLVSIIAQLDGAGASTFLLVVPPLLPLYKRLRMSPYVLFLLLAASAGLINMLPWGGPLGRISIVLDIDVIELWRPLIVIQIIGVIFIIALAIIMGFREKLRIAKLAPTMENPNSTTIDNTNNITEHSSQTAQENAAKKALLRPQFRWINATLFLLTLAALVSGILPSGYVFMIAFCVALLINFPQPKMQMDRITAHAGGAIMMASIILAAGTFLGILRESGMLTSIATALVSILPDAMLSYLHLIIGFIGVPLELVLNTDAYYLALLPIVEQITTQAGVEPTTAAYALLIGSIVGTFISPFSPALWMGLGLAKLSMGRHIRFSFFWIWGLSVLLLITALLFNLI